MASSQPALLPPTLVQAEQSRRGNPLAAYATLVEMEDRYRQSELAEFYKQVRLMMEEFLGLPDAGVRAMNTIEQLHRTYPPGDAPLPEGYGAEDALRVIARAAASTQIVIWGEEHHLPQTRSLYEPMLRALRRQGYRYLAAETFTDSVTLPGVRFPTWASGVYLRDPVFASAVRVALDLGYELVAYEETEQGPPGDASFRDRRQAENLRSRIFSRDPTAKVLILAGRGHASEVTASDGWTPMASVLKRLTGIDPFTVFAPTMGERASREEEDPRYRYATRKGLVTNPTIFVHATTGATFGDASFDSYIFWPRTRLIDGRPDWMVSTLARERVPVPSSLLVGTGRRLVQAFREYEPAAAIPVDQILLEDSPTKMALMLPPGRYWVRTIDRAGTVLAETRLGVTR